MATIDDHDPLNRRDERLSAAHRTSSADKFETKVVDQLMETLVRPPLVLLTQRFDGEVDPKITWRILDERIAGTLAWRHRDDGGTLCVAVTMAHDSQGFSDRVGDDRKTVHVVCEGFVGGERKVQRINETDSHLELWMRQQVSECIEFVRYFARQSGS